MRDHITVIESRKSKNKERQGREEKQKERCKYHLSIDSKYVTGNKISLKMNQLETNILNDLKTLCWESFFLIDHSGLQFPLEISIDLVFFQVGGCDA